MSDRKIAVGIALFFAAVYTASSTWLPTAYADADELLITGKLFSVAHPPGYALQTSFYYFLSQVFSSLNPVISMTLGTNVLAAVSVAMLYLVLRKLFTEKTYCVIGASIFGFSYLWWLYATITEVSVLAVLLTVGSLYSAISWYIKPNRLWFFLTWMMYGLLVSHFVLAITLAPGLLMLLWMGDKKPKLVWLYGGLISLIVYALCNSLLWTQNQATTMFSWNFPATVSGWLNHIFLKDYYGTAASNTPTVPNPLVSVFTVQFYQSIKLYLKFLIDHFTIFGFGLGLFGIVLGVGKKEKLWSSLGLMWLISGVYLAGYMGISRSDFNQEILQGVAQRQFLVSELVFGIFIVGGISWIRGKRWIREVVGIGVMGVILISNRSVMVNKEFRTLSNVVYKEALQAVEPNAIIICTTDISCYNLIYQTVVMRLKPDVLILPQVVDYQNKYLQAHPEIYPFKITEDQDFLPQLIAWNLPKRPIYITQGIPKLIDYAGFEVGPLYLEPRGWLSKFSLKPSTTFQTLEISDSIKHLITLHHKKDIYGAGILHSLGNSLAYIGYLSLRYGDTNTAAAYLAQANLFDGTNEQTKYLQEHMEPLSKELKIDTDPATAHEYAQAAAETKEIGLAEQYNRRAFYLDPKNKEYTQSLVSTYKKLGDIERATVFEEYLDRLVENGLR